MKTEMGEDNRIEPKYNISGGILDDAQTSNSDRSTGFFSAGVVESMERQNWRYCFISWTDVSVIYSLGDWSFYSRFRLQNLSWVPSTLDERSTAGIKARRYTWNSRSFFWLIRHISIREPPLFRTCMDTALANQHTLKDRDPPGWKNGWSIDNFAFTINSISSPSSPRTRCSCLGAPGSCLPLFPSLSQDAAFFCYYLDSYVYHSCLDFPQQHLGVFLEDLPNRCFTSSTL